jgi:hypothetical protein
MPRGAATARDDAVAALRLLTWAPRHLRDPISQARAMAALRGRRERREADFLALVRRGVYQNPPSPYRALLAHAGCELGDLTRLVRADGVEGALRALLRAGVYLTVDELQGRRPIVRGALRLAGDPARFRNPAARGGVPLTSGGSRGLGTRIGVDLLFLWEAFTDHRLILGSRGGLDWNHAVWGVPGGASIMHLLFAATAGRAAPQFFSRFDANEERRLHPRYRWSLRLLRAAAVVARRPFPPFRHAPTGDPAVLVRWLDAVRERGSTPCVRLYASSGVGLAEAAATMKTDLCGVQLLLSGEPVTPARRAAVERSGAVVLPHMGNTELGTYVGCGCFAPAASDDMHVLHDLLALIQPEEVEIPGVPPQALLASSIRPRAPLVLLNAALGDLGRLSDRACACPLADLGWPTHLTEVRSYEKLTAGGMTFYDSDLVRVLEEVLPARFGGGPLDYQLVEAETPHGDPVLRLLVHPAVGVVDPTEVATALLDAIAAGRGLQRVMGATWRDAGFVRVERRPPETTRGGKVQHLHAAARGPLPPEP